MSTHLVWAPTEPVMTQIRFSARRSSRFRAMADIIRLRSHLPHAFEHDESARRLPSRLGRAVWRSDAMSTEGTSVVFMRRDSLNALARRGAPIWVQRGTAGSRQDPGSGR